MKNLTARAFILCVLFPVICSATIVHVPGDQPTIQAGIDVATEGDTVAVANGTYTGDGNRDLDFGGKNLFLTSKNGAEFTIIDCDGTEAEPHRAFYLQSGESQESMIRGFTITGAYGDGFYFDAAVRCEGASPRLSQCVITDNNCHGVQYANDTLRISDCVVSYNTHHGITSNEGAVDIQNCELSYNGQCGFYWNSQWYGFTADITDCLIIGNNAVGLYLLIGSGLFHVQNCTMVGNDIGFQYEWNFPKIASTSTAFAQVDTSTIENSIMAFNDTYGLYGQIWAGPVIIRCNDAYGNGVEDFYSDGIGPGDDFGNFSADPLFCDTDNHDYYLNSTSPCLPTNNDCGVLIGRYDVGCAARMWTVNADGSGDAPTIQAAINLASDRDTVLCTSGTYTGDGNRDIDFLGKKILLLAQQGSVATIIDCQASMDNAHRAFFFHSGEDSSSIIDGFTITNAYSDEQGAITITGSAPRIRNCSIFGNGGCGIYCYPDLPWEDWLRIEHCKIANNTASGVRSHGGRTSIVGSDISYNGYDGVCIEWFGQLEMTGSVASSNGNVGLFMYTMYDYFYVANCTFFNNRIGLFWDFNFPKASSDMNVRVVEDTSRVINSIFAFNREIGINIYFYMSDPMQQVLCCNSYGNGSADWAADDFEAGDDFNNFSADPLFCDTVTLDFTLSENSPCAPAYSPCGELVGAYDVACSANGDGDDDNDALPSTFSLSQNYPNPFNPATVIEYDLPRASYVKLDVYNILGQKVRSLVNGSMPAGYHRATWNASEATSGIYLYRLQAGGFVESKKMILVK